MSTQFDPKAVEAFVAALWESEKVYEQVFNEKKKTFSIPLPPPNITGTLHLGHAFQQTLMDILIRFHRMQGYNVHWQAGMDHAGIATQLVVLRHIAEQGIDASQLSKEAFMQHVHRWKEISESTMTQQMQRLALLMDLKKARFTMDANYCSSVQRSFCTLYSAGLIYRGLKLVNWDPSLQSAISDLEVNTKEQATYLWNIHYRLVESEKDEAEILVATTRPETIPGDVAIAVHPEDVRYKKFIGAHVHVPLCGRTIPIISDESVDPTFGTGAVKLTPAHDFFDEKLAKKHQLPYVQLLDNQAYFLKHPIFYDCHNQKSLNSTFNVPAGMVGKSVQEARKAILLLLKESAHLGEAKPHKAVVPIGDRSGATIEPHLTWQWFLKTEQISKKAKEVVEKNEIEFFPEKYKNLYFSWMNNIQDWCISRQLVCGHTLPIWFDTASNPYLGITEQEARQRYNLPETISLTACEDVLDTWFASALWTFASLEEGEGQSNLALKRFHPFSLLITGFDIIFFWVARMIMLTLELKQSLPFKKVFFTGLVRDEVGKKMSKSQGNVLDPIDMIDGISLEALLKKRTGHLLTSSAAAKKKFITDQTKKSFPHGIAAHGSDAMRLTFAALAVHGRDLHWDMQRLAGYKHFCNKLWNASRFVREELQKFYQLEGAQLSVKQIPALKENILYQWIHRIQKEFLNDYRSALEKYRFDLAAQLIHEFFWHKFCDKFLEMAKPLLSSGTLHARQQSCLMLWCSLEEFLRSIHPIMPTISEYLWQNLKSSAPLDAALPKTLVFSEFPQLPAMSLKNPRSSGEQAIEWLQLFIFEVRKFRRDQGFSAASALRICVEAPDHVFQHFEALKLFSRNLLKNVHWEVINGTFDLEKGFEQWQGFSVESTKAFVLLSEEARKEQQNELQKVKETLSLRKQQLQEKLANEQFLKKAPPLLVKKLQEELEKLLLQLENLPA